MDLELNQGVLMRPAMAPALAPAVVGNALSDLKGSTTGPNILSPKFARAPRTNNPLWTPGGWSGAQATNHRKRKEPGGLPGEHPCNGMVDAASNTGEGMAPVAVQTAALQALEALLTSVSGSAHSALQWHCWDVLQDPTLMCQSTEPLWELSGFYEDSCHAEDIGSYLNRNF